MSSGDVRTVCFQHFCDTAAIVCSVQFQALHPVVVHVVVSSFQFLPNAGGSALYTSRKRPLNQFLRIQTHHAPYLAVSAINQTLRLSPQSLSRDLYNGERWVS